MRKPRGRPAGLDVEDGTPVLRVLSFSYKSKADAFGDSNGPGVFRRLSDDAVAPSPLPAPRHHSSPALLRPPFASSTPKQQQLIRTASDATEVGARRQGGAAAAVVRRHAAAASVSRSKSAVAGPRRPRAAPGPLAASTTPEMWLSEPPPAVRVGGGATVVVVLPPGGDAAHYEPEAALLSAHAKEAAGRAPSSVLVTCSAGSSGGGSGSVVTCSSGGGTPATSVAYYNHHHHHRNNQHQQQEERHRDSPDVCSLALSGAEVDGSACSSVAGTSSSLGAGASAAGLRADLGGGSSSSAGGGGGGGGSVAGGWSHPRTPMGSTTQLIQGKAPPRSTCGGLWSVDAALAALTLAASLGNIVRLPRLVLQYGGGSFLAVYCATSLLVGVPMALLEVGLGQLCEQGVTRVWGAVPLFTGVGIVKVVLSGLLAVYWPVLMALSLFFAVWSAKGPIPFSECKHRLNGLDGYVLSRTSGEVCLKNTFLKSPVEEPMWYSVTATFLFLLWTIALLCVFRGSRGYRRVLAVLVVLLFGGIVTVLVDSAMLPAAYSGLELLLRFDWDALLNVETWYFATVQMFFSTHIGLGNIVTGAGRFYSKSNAVWTAIALVVCSLLVGIVWVAVVFLRLGQLVQPNQLRQIASTDVPETLVLTLLYDTVARGNTEQIVASVSFLVIVCAGFASLVPLLDTILSALYVESKRHWEWWKAATVCCVIGFVLSALCMLPEWLSLIHVLDHYVVGRLAMACSVTELVAFVWIYGCGPLYTDLEFVVGSKLSPCWKILWCLSPLYLLTVEAWSVIVMPWDGIPGSHDPPWQVLLGWGLYFAGWAIICVTALRQVCIQVDYNVCQKFLSAVKPSRNWGPADPIYRHCWMQWRDATPAIKMDQTLRRRGTRDYTHSVRMATSPDPLAHLGHFPPSRGSGPFFIDSKAELAEHVCWRKEVHA